MTVEFYYCFSGRFYTTREVDNVTESLWVKLLEEASANSRNDTEFIRTVSSWKNDSFAETFWKQVEKECINTLKGLTQSQIPKNSKIFTRRSLTPQQKQLR